MNIETLFELSIIFGVMGIISYVRRDWMGLNVSVFVLFFSAMGFLFRLLS